MNRHDSPTDDRWGESFPPELRLHDEADYRPVFDRGAFAADDRLVVLALPNELGYCRLGVVVSRKAGNSVVRHRWKRVIREAFRRSRAELPGGFDLVVKPKRDANCESTAIAAGFAPLVRRCLKRLNDRSGQQAARKSAPRSGKGSGRGSGKTSDKSSRKEKDGGGASSGLPETPS